MKLTTWTILGAKLRARQRNIAVCHEIGVCVRSLFRTSLLSTEKQLFDCIRERFPSVRGLKPAFLRDCIEISTLMWRREAAGCRSLTISHFRELRNVTSDEAVRELLLDAAARSYTCRELRNKAAMKELEIAYGIPSNEARFVALTKEACQAVKSARSKLHRCQIHLPAATREERDYLEGKISAWREALQTIEQDVLDHATEMCVAKQNATEQAAA